MLELPPKLISAELQTRQPLKDVFNVSVSSEDDSLSGKSYTESPMSIDKTLSPIARPKSLIKKLHDCDVYSEEILSYLKTTEVCSFTVRFFKYFPISFVSISETSSPETKLHETTTRRIVQHAYNFG